MSSKRTLPPGISELSPRYGRKAPLMDDKMFLIAIFILRNACFAK